MALERMEVRFNPEIKSVPGYDPNKGSFRGWLAWLRRILLGELPTRMASTITASTISGVKNLGEIESSLGSLIVSDPTVNTMKLYVSVPKNLTNRKAVEKSLVEQGIDPAGVYFDYEKMYIATDMFKPAAFPLGIHFTTLMPGEEIELEVELDWCRARLDERALCTPVTHVFFHQESNGDYVFGYTIKDGGGSPEEIYNMALDIIEKYPPGSTLPKFENKGEVVAASSTTINPKYFL